MLDDVKSEDMSDESRDGQATAEIIAAAEAAISAATSVIVGAVEAVPDPVRAPSRAGGRRRAQKVEDRLIQVNGAIKRHLRLREHPGNRMPAEDPIFEKLLTRREKLELLLKELLDKDNQENIELVAANTEMPKVPKPLKGIVRFSEVNSVRFFDAEGEQAPAAYELPEDLSVVNDESSFAGLEKS